MGIWRVMIAAFMVMGLFLGSAWGQTRAAGYILTEHHIIWGDEIWGIGETVDQAKDDARNRGANLDHDGEEMDDWIDSLSVRRATADLMAAARQDRWTAHKELPGRVWGTPAEYEAIRSARARSSREVLPRDLMTREERAAFRTQMQQAAPEERNALWHRELAILERRAAAGGAVLVVLATRPDGTIHPHEMHGNGPARLGGGVRAP